MKFLVDLNTVKRFLQHFFGYYVKVVPFSVEGLWKGYPGTFSVKKGSDPGLEPPQINLC